MYERHIELVEQDDGTILVIVTYANDNDPLDLNGDPDYQG